jgi:hypothetical protein
MIPTQDQNPDTDDGGPDKGGRPRLSRKDEIIAFRVAVGDTCEEAAQAAAVGVATVKRRRADKDFMARVSELRADMLRRASGKLSHYSAGAVAKLYELMDNEDAKVSLGASKAIIDYAMKVREHDELKQELDEIKAALKAKGVM